MEIITHGRIDLDHFFSLSGALSSGKLVHHPFIVFDVSDQTKLQEELAKCEKRLLTIKEDIVDEFTVETKERVSKSTKEQIQEIKAKMKINKESLEVVIVETVQELLTYSDSTQVIAQWGGQWRSDFFKFTVLDVKNFLKENNKDIY